MFRRKAEKRMVELSPDEARMMREAILAFRNKLLSAGKPTEDVNELIIKEMSKTGRRSSPQTRQMGIKRAWGISRAQKPQRGNCRT